MFFRSLIGCIAVLSVASTSFAVEDSDDSYNFRSRCPQDGAAAGAHYSTDPSYRDGHGFPICQCVSYVADQLTDAWHPDGQFTNQSYEQARWGSAYRWRDIAHNVGIGVTGSSDNFVWNASEYWQNGIPPYNGAFTGDVAWWGANSHGAGASGHVGIVTSATQDDPGHGVRCVSWRDYNWTAYDYAEHSACKGDANFPDAFIHLTQNHQYCFTHSEEACHDLVAQLNQDIWLASTDPGSYGSGETPGPMPITGGTNSGSLPNLIPNNSDIENASKTKVTELHINEAGYCRMQIKNTGQATAGAFETRCYISDGLKIDNDPRDEGKEDTQGLAKGDTHTEHEDFTAPEYPGTYNAVFCVDSAKQVTESNEGDNCHVEDVFTVWSNPNVIVANATIGGGTTALNLGDTFSVDATIRNIGENFGKTILVGYFMDGLLIGTDTVKRENLKGGVSKVETLSQAFAPTEPGNHTLTVCADYGNRIVETNEEDNCFSLNITVNDPNPENPPLPIGGDGSDDDMTAIINWYLSYKRQHP